MGHGANSDVLIRKKYGLFKSVFFPTQALLSMVHIVVNLTLLHNDYGVCHSRPVSNTG